MDGPQESDDEGYVRDNFAEKVRRVGRRIPFAEDAVTAYYCLIDDKTPKRVRVILGSALAYFIVPTDLIPDFIAGLGFADDASVLALAFGAVAKHVNADHRLQAQNFLGKEPDSQPLDNQPPNFQPNEPEPPGE